MPRIVAVHGIAQQYKGPTTLHDEWYPALRDGVLIAGGTPPSKGDLVCVFYAEPFRPKGTMAVGLPPYDAGDVTDPFEQDLLAAWWRAAAEAEPGQVLSPDERTMGRTPQFVQAALNALSRSTFFTGFAERAFIFNLKQVSSYFRDDKNGRPAVAAMVEKEVQADTWLMIGHSLGSVVAYECLCAHPEWPITTLVTLGSPLGIRNLIFDRLRPPPVDGLGAWPGGVRRWVNIADGGDVVALVKDLRPLFGPRVENLLVHNGAEAHAIRPYLTARETGRVIASALG
jgi:pimeloyl-ACP methyl ester carboxylesterase